jgi:hypothetical protein
MVSMLRPDTDRWRTGTSTSDGGGCDPGRMVTVVERVETLGEMGVKWR